MTRAQIARNLWQRPSYRAKQRKAHKDTASVHRRYALARWERPEYREAQRRAMAQRKLNNTAGAPRGPHTRRCCNRPRLGHPRATCGGRLRRRTWR